MSLYDEDSQYWIAGYQREDGTYIDLQDKSHAVRTDGEDVEVDWERWEKFDNRWSDFHGARLQRADHAIIGWIDEQGIVNYATLPDGVDIDLFDFESWVEDYG